MGLCGWRLHRAQRLRVRLVRSRCQAFVSFCCECSFIVVPGRASVRRWPSGLSVAFGCCERCCRERVCVCGRALLLSLGAWLRAGSLAFIPLRGVFFFSAPQQALGWEWRSRGVPAHTGLPRGPHPGSLCLSPGARPAVPRPLSAGFLPPQRAVEIPLRLGNFVIAQKYFELFLYGLSLGIVVKCAVRLEVYGLRSFSFITNVF